MTEALLTVRDLHVTFDLPEGEVAAVRGASFSVPAGSTVALVGESGSGKTVVSQAIMGLLPKAARIAGGSILFRDPDGPGPIDIARLPRDGRAMRDIRGGRISIIFQEPMSSLSPLHTIGDQVSEALSLHRRCSAAESRELTRDMLRAVGFPDPDRALRTYPFELSGGLRQRAMIAMALVCRPALLIADEPTTALDVTIQAQILKQIVDLQAELGMAVLLITHDLGVVANVAKDVVVMYHGEIMESGSAEAIFRSPGHPYLKALLHAVPRFDMKPGERLVPLREIAPAEPTTIDRRGGKAADSHGAGKAADSHGAGKAADSHGAGKAADSRGVDEAPILSVRDIHKSFGIRKASWFGDAEISRIKAVDGVSFDINRGECLGLVGESGCGKTTLSKIIMRALTPDSGQVIVSGESGPVDISTLSGRDLLAFRRRIQFIFQDPVGSLNPRIRVEDIIAEPLVIHGVGDPAARARSVAALLAMVGLDIRHAKRYPHSFSGGQRQRIGIARALALRPELVICDEPVSALDVSIQAQILNLLKDLQKSLGLTYLFVSHNLAVVNYIADRIAVMCRGRLVELAPREALFQNPVHPYTRALLAAVPEPDLDHPLDFGQLAGDRASDPASWPPPFTDDGRSQPVLSDIGGGHLVRTLDGAGGATVEAAT